MSDIDWFAIDKQIRTIVKSNYERLAADRIEGINHYLSVDEYEMALELLCLALMHAQDTPLVDLESLAELAKEVGLDQQSVFDDSFWAHFTASLDERRENDH